MPTGSGAASNRAPAGKGRAVAVVVVIPSSGEGAATRAAVGKKENTPERVDVKEEENDKVTLQAAAAKGARACKAAAGVVSKANVEVLSPGWMVYPKIGTISVDHYYKP